MSRKLKEYIFIWKTLRTYRKALNQLWANHDKNGCYWKDNPDSCQCLQIHNKIVETMRREVGLENA